MRYENKKKSVSSPSNKFELLLKENIMIKTRHVGSKFYKANYLSQITNLSTSTYRYLFRHYSL